MKIKNKIEYLLLIIVIVFILYSNYAVLATTNADLKATYTKSSVSIKDFAQDVFGFIRTTAMISSVVLLAYCGMRIVFGSVEQKAEYKKAIMPIIVGTLVVLFATTIVDMVQKL